MAKTIPTTCPYCKSRLAETLRMVQYGTATCRVYIVDCENLGTGEKKPSLGWAIEDFSPNEIEFRCDNCWEVIEIDEPTVIQILIREVQ